MFGIFTRNRSQVISIVLREAQQYTITKKKVCNMSMTYQLGLSIKNPQNFKHSNIFENFRSDSYLLKHISSKFSP